MQKYAVKGYTNSKIQEVIMAYRTDLALEAREMYYETAAAEAEIDGVEVSGEEFGEDLKVTRVKITSPAGEKALNKPMGNYVTIEIPNPKCEDSELYKKVRDICAKEIKNILNLSGKETVMVIGLGNQNIIADALGPRVVEELVITRHLKKYIPSEFGEETRSVCALSPGVLGTTGIETGEVVKGLVEKVNPDILIAVDALCSRRMDRVNSTIQIADTGITPGAGVGNTRMSLSRETLGIPVIAVGVPTVVDAATIAGDTIDLIAEEFKSHSAEKGKLLENLGELGDEPDKYTLIKKVLSPSFGDLIVAPKDVDKAVEDISSVIAAGINLALHDEETAV